MFPLLTLTASTEYHNARQNIIILVWKYLANTRIEGLAEYYTNTCKWKLFAVQQWENRQTPMQMLVVTKLPKLDGSWKGGVLWITEGVHALHPQSFTVSLHKPIFFSNTFWCQKKNRTRNLTLCYVSCLAPSHVLWSQKILMTVVPILPLKLVLWRLEMMFIVHTTNSRTRVFFSSLKVLAHFRSKQTGGFLLLRYTGLMSHWRQSTVKHVWRK